MTHRTEAVDWIGYTLKRVDDGNYDRAAICAQVAQAHAMLAIVDWLAELHESLHNMTADEYALRVKEVNE